ncbi:Hypothetical_protein [Hexamita inflata]|uniref:Hypothetical_protein n=1 Tax=Hexamita inflata TaxID=28002 RepID=A0AA86UX71_9EUKA|nr:Hypothetical protein HINF_LOCUS59204 [Hexamita inflata]
MLLHLEEAPSEERVNTRFSCAFIGVRAFASLGLFLLGRQVLFSLFQDRDWQFDVGIVKLTWQSMMGVVFLSIISTQQICYICKFLVNYSLSPIFYRFQLKIKKNQPYSEQLL